MLDQVFFELVIGSESNFEFAVKFFEPNPEQLKNDYTRYSKV